LFGTTTVATTAATAAVVLEQSYGGRIHVMHFGNVAVVVHILLAESRGRRGRLVARLLVPTAQARRTPRWRLGPAALQRLLERHPELSVEVRVDERVEGRVEVAHPEHEHRHPPGHPRTAFQQRAHHVPAADAFTN